MLSWTIHTTTARPCTSPTQTPALGAPVTSGVRAPRTARGRRRARTVRTWTGSRATSRGDPHRRRPADGRPRSGGGPTLVAPTPSPRYRFLLSTPAASWWLTAAGLADHEVSDASDFRLVATPRRRRGCATRSSTRSSPTGSPGRRADAERALPVLGACRAGWDATRSSPAARPTARQFYGGDLDGIIDHLDHVQCLGADTVYLTPFFPAGSNHRYDAVHLRPRRPAARRRRGARTGSPTPCTRVACGSSATSPPTTPATRTSGSPPPVRPGRARTGAVLLRPRHRRLRGLAGASSRCPSSTGLRRAAHGPHAPTVLAALAARRSTAGGSTSPT